LVPPGDDLRRQGQHVPGSGHALPEVHRLRPQALSVRHQDTGYSPQTGPAGPSGEHRQDAGERGRPVPAHRRPEGRRLIPPKQNGTPNGPASAADRDPLLTPAPASSVNSVELNDLARELAAAFGNMVNSYREFWKLSAEEAAKRAAQTSPEHIDRILNAPADSVNWLDLDALARKDESLALERWQQIKNAARDEIRSGHRAARAIEDGGGPWERARFLAVCAELTEAWRPCNAVEQLLVDQLAQWQVLLWRWQEA